MLCIINRNLLSFEKLSRLPKAKYMVLEMRMALLENVNVWSESKDNCVSICTVLIKRQLRELLLFSVEEFVELP